MNASDKIINCEVCIKYARSIGKENWLELYNMAWLKVREIELKHPDKTIRNHKTYFYSALRSSLIDQKRKSNDSKLTSITSIELMDDDYIDVWEIESKILHQWLNQPTKDKNIRFLQNIVNLAIEFKSVKRAASKTKMSIRTFFKYLAEAKNEIENEHFLLTDSHPLSERDLV